MILKCDPFVYSSYSQKSISAAKLTPLQIYKTAKKKGMNLVTLADQNTIRGCLSFLNQYPYANDFFISEEVTTWDVEFKIPLKFGVFNITELHHNEITQLRRNAEELIAYLKKENITFVLSHIFYQMSQQAQNPKFISKLLDLIGNFEVHHGKNLKEHNIMLAYFIKSLSHKGICGGSHAHLIQDVASTYTLANGDCLQDFLVSLNKGQSWTEGRHGTVLQDGLKKGFKNFKFLRRKKNLTPTYASLLGATQVNPCELPEKLIEI